MKRLLPVFFATILVFMFSGTTVSAGILEVCPSGGGCTYEYTGGGAVNAIQTAIDAATDGDTVYIHNGTYASPEIDMTSSHVGITIEGESSSGTILNESYFRIGSATYGASSNITVKNLKILNSYDVNNGIEIVNSTGVDLLGLVVDGSGGEGFKITGSATVDILNCLITNGHSTGIRVNGAAAEVVIYNTDISDNTYQGILVEDTGGLGITNARIGLNGTVGLQVNQGSAVVIRNTNIYGNGTYGISLSSVSVLTNDYNNVYGNVSGGYTGTIGAGTHSIAVDPDLGAGGIPNCTSGLINTGDPTITDLDSTISDIGLYGGPYAVLSSESFLCMAGLFCYVTDAFHECIQCLSDTDCPETYICNLDTNSCESTVVDTGDDDGDDSTVDDQDDTEEDDGNLPQTAMYKEDPLFYTILCISMILAGYLFYAQRKYGGSSQK